MSSTAKSIPALLFGIAMLLVSGCTQSPAIDSQALAAYRAEFTLADEPEDIQTVAGVRSNLLGGVDAHDDHGDLDHDHDGDGQPDHAAEDHPAGDHDGDEAAQDKDGEDHDADEHDGEDHDHEGDGHAVHAGKDHDEHAHETEPQEVAMVGHIGGLPNPWAGSHPDYPFAKSEATFFLADPQAAIENAESGHQHAPGEECAFCAAHAADKADMLAVVRFVDENGKVLQTDVRELFDVKENDTVIVHGKAYFATGDILVVDARGLYIRN